MRTDFTTGKDNLFLQELKNNLINIQLDPVKYLLNLDIKGLSQRTPCASARPDINVRKYTEKVIVAGNFFILYGVSSVIKAKVIC